MSTTKLYYTCTEANGITAKVQCNLSLAIDHEFKTNKHATQRMIKALVLLTHGYVWGPALRQVDFYRLLFDNVTVEEA